MVPVGLRHVGRVGGVPARRVIAPMGGDALAAMEELDGRRADPRVHDFVDEGIGHGVVVAVELDVVVDVDARHGPLAVDERLGRQRPQRGVIEAFEELTAAGAVEAHGPRVQIGEELGEARVEGAREKKVSWRSRARIHRSTTNTPASILALSRGFAGRAGRIAVP